MKLINLICLVLIAGSAPAQTIDYNTQLKNIPYFMPESSGAKGDGATDDTVAFKAAITKACASSTRKVLVLRGNYVIAPLLATTPTLPLCSGLTIDGQNVGIVTIKASGGSFYSLFGGATALSNVTLKNLYVNQNSANNALVSAGDTATHPRIIFHTGNGGTNNVIDGVKVSDFRGEWEFFVASTNSKIINTVTTGVGGGSVDSDSSLLYCEHDAASGCIIEGNVIVASARNAKMVHTPIEIHSPNSIVANNTIKDMIGCVIAVGQEASTTVNVEIANNTCSGGFVGISIWSYSGFGATPYGLANSSVHDNIIDLNQTSYISQGGATACITFNDLSNLPFNNISINNNTCRFELSNAGTDPFSTEAGGIVYTDDTNGTVSGCFSCVISSNKIYNSPASGIRYSSNGSSIHIIDNTIINPGSHPNAGLTAPYRAGIFVSASAALSPIKDLRIENNDITDNLATARFTYGVELATLNTGDITVKGSVNCLDVTCASLIKAVTPNTVTQLPAVTVIANVPASEVLPALATLAGSTFWSMQEAKIYTWNGGAYDSPIPHNIAPTPSLCGTSPSIVAVSDRDGRVAFGSGTVTSCTITFGTAFTSAPEGIVVLRSGGGANAGNIRFTPTTTQLIIASGDGTTNYAGAIFSWHLTGN